MRLRRGYKKARSEEANGEAAEGEQVKEAKPVTGGFSLRKPLKYLRQITDNPNFAFQVMVVLLTLTAEDKKMDRRIDNMTSSIDALRGITEVLGGSMQSLKTAAEAPKRIRNLLGSGNN